MSESRSFSDDGQEFAHGSFGSNSAIQVYLSRVARPDPESMQQAADVVGAAYREIEHTQDALSICMDLARDVPNATTVLAGMISTGHEVIPKRWRSDPVETRMVLSMVGCMEVGYLRAQQAAIRRGPAFPELSERVHEIERLLENLHT